MPTVTVPAASAEVRDRVEPLLAAVFEQASGLDNIALSPLSAHVLLECVRFMPGKLNERDILSTSTVFLTTLLLARRLATPSSGTEISGAELDELRRWGELVLDGFSTRLDAAAASFFQKPPVPDILLFDGIEPGMTPVGVQLGPGLTHVFQTLGSHREIKLADVVLRSLDDPEAQLPRRIEEWQLGALVRGMKGVAKTNVGRIPRMTREADDKELSLSIQEYAEALATVLRSAEGEFTFALFGPWGSGKTTLTRLLKPLLEKPGYFVEQTGASKQRFARWRYEVAGHNAWKYRQPPEAWVYLYKSLAERAGAGLRSYDKMALAARASHFRYGPWPLVGALVSLAVLAMPLSATLQLAGVLATLIGAGALAHVAAIAPKVQTKVKAIFEKNAKLSTGPERLGMLALIGEDVKALLSAWTKKLPGERSKDGQSPSVNERERSMRTKLVFPLVVLAGVAGGWAYGLYSSPDPPKPGILVQSLETVARILAGPDSTSKPKTDSIDSENWILLAWIGLALVTMLGPWLISAPGPDRVLLIVDDLDRCGPDDMLTVIENMKLLLVDDPVLNNRLQVLMLVDERVLAFAIAKHYTEMIAERAADIVGVSADNARLIAEQEIIAEQNEKLFACHLRLPVLSDRDVATLAVKLSSRELEENEEQDRQAADRRRIDELHRAERILQNAIAAQESAKSTLESVREGQKRPIIDIDAPSSLPVPKNLQRLGVDGLPPSAQEKAARMRQKAAAEAFNDKLAAMTAEERLADNPDVVRRYDQTVAMVEQARGGLERARNRPAQLEVIQEDTPTFPFDEGDVRFTRDEVAELGRLVPDYFRAINRRPSPRAIRTLLFKIQLFRLLLQVRAPNRPLESFSIVSILDAFRQAADIEPTAKQDEETVVIARQVI
ncbi:P-loop NTPase fold protein [Mesorhizobium sp. WSM3879]|uniref:P-loop NTPase fold protein n=1 Tax=Mesorhizobium sp. WSM3879 TaxID=2029406 RepID=UPI0015C873A7|nr:P-loop NTPase fold protein [Mesorhizobium sp. WSM3879]